MPHHPSEENAPDHIFDQVAKESSNSTASDHPNHKENKESVKATAADHKSKGPQIVESMFGLPIHQACILTRHVQTLAKPKTRRLSERRPRR
jgi:hypothetical protein